MAEKLFILYDGRAKVCEIEDASIYVTASTEEEARKDGKDEAWQDGLWVEYDVLEEGVLVNPKERWDLLPTEVRDA